MQEWINSKVPLCSTGNYIQYPVINHNGKNMKKNIYIKEIYLAKETSVYVEDYCKSLFFFFFLFLLIELWLIYNVVLDSGVQQSDSVIFIYIFFFRFFSIIGYYKILNIVPCAIQYRWVLVVYLFYT